MKSLKVVNKSDMRLLDVMETCNTAFGKNILIGIDVNKMVHRVKSMHLEDHFILKFDLDEDIQDNYSAVHFVKNGSKFELLMV